VVGLLQVTDDDELMLITQQGKTIRMAAKDIRTIGRATQGREAGSTLKGTIAPLSIAPPDFWPSGKRRLASPRGAAGPEPGDAEEGRLKGLRLLPLTTVALLAMAACGGPSLERQLLAEFFDASRLYDKTALAALGTASFNPATDGVVRISRSAASRLQSIARADF